MPPPPSSHAHEPYCGSCGYILTGLTESSKCPECGRPIVEVLTRRSDTPNFGKRYRSRATLFGLPVIDIAVGPKNGELRGKAKGIVAIGDQAIGGLAVGGVAVGVVAFGGVCAGLFCAGGVAVGLLAAVGGLATGVFAAGGCAVGIFASGGGAIGYAAQGGGALGVHVRDGRTIRSARGPEVFEQLAWFFGSWPATGAAIWHPSIVAAGLILGAAAVVALIALVRLWREPRVQLPAEGHSNS